MHAEENVGTLKKSKSSGMDDSRYVFQPYSVCVVLHRVNGRKRIAKFAAVS